MQWGLDRHRSLDRDRWHRNRDRRRHRHDDLRRCLDDRPRLCGLEEHGARLQCSLADLGGNLHLHLGLNLSLHDRGRLNLHLLRLELRLEAGARNLHLNLLRLDHGPRNLHLNLLRLNSASRNLNLHLLRLDLHLNLLRLRRCHCWDLHLDLGLCLDCWNLDLLLLLLLQVNCCRWQGLRCSCGRKPLNLPLGLNRGGCDLRRL